MRHQCLSSLAVTIDKYSMIDLDTIGEDLFSKIRGRFPNVTIGDDSGTITNEPKEARFFDFDYKAGERNIGKVSVSISEDDGLSVIYSRDFISNEDQLTQKEWYNFLKELRQFARKRLLNFDVRDVNKSNLSKRDYKFLAANRSGDGTMNESKLYGTARVSYQKMGEARIMIKHTESINQESATGRTQKIGKIYIESADGERFRYPFKHLSGARAMARHVAEGGNAYDDFGKHIVGLSEEMAKLRKFKNYMGRSAVMAESLSEYMDVVKDRIKTVKKTIESLQKPAYYAETFAAFEIPMMEDVPADVAENWIDQLTIKQFNEELADVFPYIYKLVGEATKAKSLGPDDLVSEAGKGIEAMKKAGNAKADAEEKEGHDDMATAIKKKANLKKTKEEIELEAAFEATMGQFSDHVCEECGNQSWTTLEMTVEEIEEACSSMRKKKKNESDVEEGERHGNSKIYDKCWKGYSKVPGKKAGEPGSCKKNESEEDVSEAYINTSKDAIEVLGALRGKGKAIERGQDDDQGNLANQYVSDVWDVYSFIEARTNGFSGLDKNAKAAIDAMMKLRGEAKKLETEPGSGKNARFGNQIVTALYPVMEYLYTTDFDRNKKEDDTNEGIDPKSALDAIMKKDPGDEGIGYVFDKFASRMSDEDADELAKKLAEFYPEWYEQHYQDEGNAYSGAVAQAKKDGKKKGDEIDGPDGEKITLEKDQKTPLGEFILSYYDRETGVFPKGETAVLTMVEKDYGDEFIEPAKSFIESVHQTYEAFEQSKSSIESTDEYSRMRELAGLR